MHRLLLVAILILIAGCGRSSSPPATSSTPPTEQTEAVPKIPVGLVTHSLGSAERAVMADLGVTHVRYTLYGSLWLGDPAYREVFAAGVRGAVADGMQVLVVFHQLAPEWGPEDAARFLGERAAEFPEVEVWQVGNEVPFGGGDGATHARWHTLAYQAIKAADPDALVVSMATVGSPNHFPSQFLTDFLAANPPMDALVAHAYGWPLGDVIRDLGPLVRGALAGREVPLWLTEFGTSREIIPPWPAYDTTEKWEEEQAKEWRLSVEAAAKAGFARIYGYALQTEEPHETHGIVRPEGTPRPAAVWLQGYLKN